MASFWRNRFGLVMFITALWLSSVLPASATAKTLDQKLVCVDPGHQQYGNNDLEPVAPDSKERKPKVSSGTSGIVTEKPEYVVTLEVSLLLKQKLETLGYQIAMTRESHRVDISNIERAQLCNELQADLAVRIHADGDSSQKTQGISLLYPANGAGNDSIVAQSKNAAEIILQQTTAATGAVSRGIVPRSDLTGFNWSKVPSVLVEMGFMTNPDEDRKLSDPDYLNQLAEGIAAGVNAALATPVNEPEVEEQFRSFVPVTRQLYHFDNGKMTRTPYALSPQILHVSAVRGDWGKVNTWLGEQWVPLDHALTPVTSVDKQIELQDNTPIYRSPLDAEPAGRLSSQRVKAHEQWKEWYLIDTWLGEMWVKQEN